MKKLVPYLVIAGVAVGAVAIVYRVKQLRMWVFGA